MPQAVRVSATRSATCLSDHSRSAVPSGPAEVLLRQDVGGVHAPGLGHLDAQLLEGHRAVAVVGDAGVTAFPAHLVVGVDALGGEVAADADLGSLGGDGHGAGVLLRGRDGLRFAEEALLLGMFCLGCFRCCSSCHAPPTPPLFPTNRVASRSAVFNQAPGEGDSRLTTTCSGRTLPRDTRCCGHYITVVTRLSTNSLHHPCRSRAVRDIPPDQRRRTPARRRPPRARR